MLQMATDQTNQGVVQMVTKTCKECKENLPRDANFYKAGKYWQSRCKPCHNKMRNQFKTWVNPNPPPKKPRGFQALSFETRCRIIQKINGGTTYKDVAQEFGIKYGTLIQWKKKGWLKVEINTKEKAK